MAAVGFVGVAFDGLVGVLPFWITAVVISRDLILVVADRPLTTADVLGRLRAELEEQRPRGLERKLQDPRKIQALAVQLEPSLRDARNVQQIVNEMRELIALTFQHFARHFRF